MFAITQKYSILDTDISIIAIACIAFFAGFIDSIVGGGGLVQVPAMFIIFPHFAVPQIIGTNRFASFAGTSVAGYQYAKKVAIPWRTVFYAGIGAAVMSFLGATISSLIDAAILKPIMLVLMTLIAIYTYRNKDFGQIEITELATKKIHYYGILIGSLAGFYNGFIGPGTGSLLVFGFVSVVGYNFLMASGVSKIVNVVADVSSLIFFLFKGFVVFKIAIPMMVCNMLGSYLGSKMAISRGNAFVRMVFLVVVFGLILRFGYDIVKVMTF
jgi:uncharacterized membrane protein YfcA